MLKVKVETTQLLRKYKERRMLFNQHLLLQSSNEYINGREYVITVKDADGKAYAGGVVNVGIDELLDGKLGNEPVGAYIADHKDAV